MVRASPRLQKDVNENERRPSCNASSIPCLMAVLMVKPVKSMVLKWKEAIARAGGAPVDRRGGGGGGASCQTASRTRYDSLYRYCARWAYQPVRMGVTGSLPEEVQSHPNMGGGGSSSGQVLGLGRSPSG